MYTAVDSRIPKLPALIASAAFAWFAVSSPAYGKTKNEQAVEDIWAEAEPALRAEGFTKEMLRPSMLWTEVQYHLGMCAAYISNDDIIYWRMWWIKNKTIQGPFSQKIKELGDKGYYEGFQDSLKKPLGKDHCERVFKSWIAEMKEAMAVLNAAETP